MGVDSKVKIVNEFKKSKVAPNIEKVADTDLTDVFLYFKEVARLFDTEFADQQPTQNFVNNVFNEVMGNEVTFSCNPISSSVIEPIIHLISTDLLERFCEAISNNLDVMCRSVSGASVIRKLIRTSSKRGIKSLQVTEESNGKNEKITESDIFSDNHLIYCRNFMERIANHVLNNVTEYMVFNKSTVFVLKTCLCCLLRLENNEDNSEETIQIASIIPKEWKVLAAQISERIYSSPNLLNMPNKLLIACLSERAQYEIKIKQSVIKNLFQALIKKYENNKLALFKYRDVHLFDTAISIANKDNLAIIYNHFYAHNIVAGIAVSTSSDSYRFAKFIDVCKSKVQLKEILPEIRTCVASIISTGSIVLLLALSKACQRLQFGQKMFVTIISEGLKCDDENKLASLIMKFLPLDEAENHTVYSVRGAGILEAMLYFKDPTIIIDGLICMEPKELTTLFENEQGKGVLDAVFESEYISNTSRNKFINRFEKIAVQLARSKHGSHILESLWEKSEHDQKVTILNKLCSSIHILVSNEYGNEVCKKLNAEMKKGLIKKKKYC